MTTEKQNAIVSCLLTALGVFFGAAFYLILYGRWINPGIILTTVYFIDKVLFNALLMSIFLGTLLSILVYPFQYYFLKRAAVISSYAYYLFGFGIGFMLLSYAKISF